LRDAEPVEVGAVLAEAGKGFVTTHKQNIASKPGREADMMTDAQGYFPLC
jgi:hypothetical protein